MSFHRLIASDVDGTLIPEESTFMPEIMWQRIEEIWEKGCLFIAASGRQYPSLRALFAPVADHMAFLAENGAGLYYRDELVAERFFDRQLALELARYVREIPGCELIAGGVESCIFPKTQAFADHVYREMKLQVREVHSFDELPEKMMKIAIWCPDGVENHVDAISHDWGGRVKFAVSGSVWIDFNAADKGLGLTSA
ncbi:MAG: HAD family phosphatase [Oscillospiraceae bacterium]|nr:HAD family phosphatase [Oscillospiraceae bacterium]